ncbi:isochorismatase [Mycolicibacterium aurum]|uniref:Isochorismatase n=1 Tax=Mycolicibacterium aurum TaxID=1791 RepID=A0A3S4S862_MYCAU|nr:isochorismatase family cysteine hydrolase [Mycolicibacterium aurum]VEG58582.1 isochorismatase [Mycolicibacterium aurum]
MNSHFVYGAAHELDPAGEFADWLNPRRTAVVSIDMHEGHLSTDPACPCPAPRGRDIVTAIDEFHRTARDRGVPVIHARSELRASGADDVNGISSSAWRVTFPKYVGAIPGADQHALQGSRWTEFVTEVAPNDEVVTGKKRLSAFYPTDLDFLLRQMGVTAVVLNGIMADCCVLNTAFDASNLGYRVTVLQDLVRGTDTTLEAAALSMVSLHLGLVTASGALVDSWDGVLRDQG